MLFERGQIIIGILTLLLVPTLHRFPWNICKSKMMINFLTSLDEPPPLSPKCYKNNVPEITPVDCLSKCGRSRMNLFGNFGGCFFLISHDHIHHTVYRRRLRMETCQEHS